MSEIGESERPDDLHEAQVRKARVELVAGRLESAKELASFAANQISKTIESGTSNPDASFILQKIIVDHSEKTNKTMVRYLLAPPHTMSHVGMVFVEVNEGEDLSKIEFVDPTHNPFNYREHIADGISSVESQNDQALEAFDTLQEVYTTIIKNGVNKSNDVFTVSHIIREGEEDIVNMDGKVLDRRLLDKFAFTKQLPVSDAKANRSQFQLALMSTGGQGPLPVDPNRYIIVDDL